MQEYKSFHKFVKTKFYELEIYVDEFYAWILIMHSGYLYSKQSRERQKKIARRKFKLKRNVTEFFYFCVKKAFLHSFHGHQVEPDEMCIFMRLKIWKLRMLENKIKTSTVINCTSAAINIDSGYNLILFSTSMHLSRERFRESLQIDYLKNVIILCVLAIVEAVLLSNKKFTNTKSLAT